MRCSYSWLNTTAALAGSLTICFALSHASCSEDTESTPAANQLTTQEEISAVSEKQISQWIADLDANVFNTREEAQNQLEKTGMPAVEAVAQAATSSSLETYTRAINILLSWSESADRELGIAALEQLSQLKNSPREASIANKLLSEARENAALASIVELGGAFQPDRQVRSLHTTLQVIIGKKWTGSDSGLKYLANVPRATTVSFRCAPLGDEALHYLENLSQLKRVEIYGNNFSKEAIAKLQSTLPEDVDFDIRSAAFLGVEGGQHGGRAMVNGVVPDGAADRAGLQVGDIILEIDNREVEDFQALTQMIAKHEPGDTVTLTVVRQGEPIELPVTFSSWGLNSQRPNQMPMGQFQEQILQVPNQRILIDRR